MNKKILIIFGMVFLIGILIISLASAADPLYCCERLKNNPSAWCQDATRAECATGVNPLSKTGDQYKSISALCQSTSYCKSGTCVNPLEGSCMPNTPQVVCNNNGGVWKDKNMGELDECKLGCCLLGNQVAFVTLTACKMLSANQGLLTDYRPDIQTELECIASITSDKIGACVHEVDYQRTCEMISQTDCKKIDKAEFHDGYLCSAQQLTTNCGPSKETMCKDEKVYFIDTCGNIANIYDSGKITDTNYWTYIQDPTCDDGKGNKNSKTCGACDYFSGSMCKSYTQTKPTYGNYICSSLDCTYNGKPYLHGETWCATNTKPSLDNSPGSRYFRMMCYNGEVTVEPCSEFRNEVCVQDQVNNFKVAGCVVNKWQDCTNQSSKEDCLDIYARDCKWITGFSIMKAKDKDGKIIDLGKDEHNISGSCVPSNSSGFDFWSGEGNGPEICSMGSAQCVVKYDVSIIFGSRRRLQTDLNYRMAHCVQNCYCIEGYKLGDGSNKYENHRPATDPTSYEAWKNLMNNICTSLGDCGNKKNYLGYFGENKTIFTSEFIKKP
jgi:hypothetical protein